uniref:Uncharacterized protein n=1 Tax=Knipowitschia caucasica TaxID=637954 RepID=A0AAV2IV62_KNICA
MLRVKPCGTRPFTVGCLRPPPAAQAKTYTLQRRDDFGSGVHDNHQTESREATPPNLYADGAEQKCPF